MARIVVTGGRDLTVLVGRAAGSSCSTGFRYKIGAVAASATGATGAEGGGRDEVMEGRLRIRNVVTLFATASSDLRRVVKADNTICRCQKSVRGVASASKSAEKWSNT